MGTWELVRSSLHGAIGLLPIFRSLRQKLPFDDDEFDHVHIQNIAFAVPENKVTSETICDGEYFLTVIIYSGHQYTRYILRRYYPASLNLDVGGQSCSSSGWDG